MSEAVFGFLGVIIGSFIPWIKEWLNERRIQKESGRYLAIRVICLLDEYLDKCCEIAGDDGTIMGRPAGRTENGNEFYEPQIPLPAPPHYPRDIDWKSINSDLMYQLLELPNKARKTNNYIHAAYEDSYPPDYNEFFEARWEGYAKLGIDIIELQNTLQKKYKLPKQDFALNPEWNAKHYLEDKINQVKEAQEKRYESHKNMISKITKI